MIRDPNAPATSPATRARKRIRTEAGELRPGRNGGVLAGPAVGPRATPGPRVLEGNPFIERRSAGGSVETDAPRTQRRHQEIDTRNPLALYTLPARPGAALVGIVQKEIGPGTSVLGSFLLDDDEP
jgi:hypothetical protein